MSGPSAPFPQEAPPALHRRAAQEFALSSGEVATPLHPSIAPHARQILLCIGASCHLPQRPFCMPRTNRAGPLRCISDVPFCATFLNFSALRIRFSYSPRTRRSATPPGGFPCASDQLLFLAERFSRPLWRGQRALVRELFEYALSPI